MAHTINNDHHSRRAHHVSMAKKDTMLWINRDCLQTSSGRQLMLSIRVHAYSPMPRHRCAFSPPINFMTHYGKESKTSATEIAGDGSGQIHARAEIRRVSELLAMAINGRWVKSPNTIV